MTCHSIKHMTCLRNTCPDFRFHLKTKNRFTLEIKLHTPTVKLRLARLEHALDAWETFEGGQVEEALL